MDEAIHSVEAAVDKEAEQVKSMLRSHVQKLISSCDDAGDEVDPELRETLQQSLELWTEVEATPSIGGTSSMRTLQSLGALRAPTRKPDAPDPSKPGQADHISFSAAGGPPAARAGARWWRGTECWGNRGGQSRS